MLLIVDYYMLIIICIWNLSIFFPTFWHFEYRC